MDAFWRALYEDGKGKLDMIYDHEKEVAFDRARRAQEAMRDAKVPPGPGAGMQNFTTGATRSADEHKHDFEGFLSPTALDAYGDYMTRHRYQRDGSLRASDNWQKGIPMHKYMASLVRHVFDLWRAWRGTAVVDKDSGKYMTLLDICSAILFNVQGFMHEVIKRHGEKALIVCDKTRDAIKEGREFSFYNCDAGSAPGGLQGQGVETATRIIGKADTFGYR